MTTFFSKPLDALTADDITSLADTLESLRFELKSELPFPNENNRTGDSWMNPPAPNGRRKGPEDYAREGLFKELCAFANSEGGWLVLGMGESADRPKRATVVQPLPDCHDLAEALERAGQEWLDPPVPGLRIRGIEVGGEPGAGVVVARVPRSPLRPHRLNKAKRSREAYRRVSDSSQPMSMRDIQEMAIERTRASGRMDERIETLFQKHAIIRVDRNRKGATFKVVAVPESGPLAVDRPYLIPGLFERRPAFQGRSTAGTGGEIRIEPVDEAENGGAVVPVLRGGQREWIRRYAPPGRVEVTDAVMVEIAESGDVSLVARTTPDVPALSIRWILADIANVLLMVDRVRLAGGDPDAAYALEIELRHDVVDLTSRLVIQPNGARLGLLEDQDPNYSAMLPSGLVRLPRYPVLQRANFPVLLTTVMNDILNLLGRPHRDDVVIDVEAEPGPEA